MRPMDCKHLNIDFLETGDVRYRFFRHHSEFMLHRYLIEWPAKKVEIIGGQCLRDHNFRSSVTASGFLLLEWDRVLEEKTGFGRGVDYIKRGYLKRPLNEPTLWHYREKVNIEPDFGLWLHSPRERISAIKCRSTAEFTGTDGCRKCFRPRELTERVFHEAGVLDIDWTLEVLDEPRRT